MSDLTTYTKDRARRDPEFAKDLEAGYATFKFESCCARRENGPA